MIFMCSRLTATQDEGNMVETMCVDFIKAVFTVFQDFIVDLMGKWAE